MAAEEFPQRLSDVKRPGTEAVFNFVLVSLLLLLLLVLLRATSRTGSHSSLYMPSVHSGAGQPPRR